MLDSIAAALGVKKAGLIAGFIGAIISLQFITAAHTWPARVFVALSGTFCAAFFSPALAEWAGASDKVEGGIAFGVGLFGMTAAGAIIASLRELKIAEAIATWFKRPGG